MRLRLLLSASFVIVAIVGVPTAHADIGSGCRFQICPTTLPDGYHYSYVHGVFYGSTNAASGADGRGRPVEWFYELACTGNETIDANGNGGDRNCMAAISTCPPGQIRMWTFQRPASSAAPPRRLPGARCMGVPKAIPLADAQAALVRYLKDKYLPHPVIDTAPPTGGLVNLPQIYATADSAPVALTVTQPLPAVLNAEPHYGWNYGDGTAGPDEAGTPYRPGILPKDHPEYYLTHTYAVDGVITATLIVTWKGTFTVAGITGTFSIPDIPLVASRALTIFQARSELVAAQ